MKIKNGVFCPTAGALELTSTTLASLSQVLNDSASSDDTYEPSDPSDIEDQLLDDYDVSIVLNFLLNQCFCDYFFSVMECVYSSRYMLRNISFVLYCQGQFPRKT